MFTECTSLLTIPLLNTSTAKWLSGLFHGCSSLVSIPQLNTNNVVNMEQMFFHCHNLAELDISWFDCYEFDLQFTQLINRYPERFI